MAGELRGQTVVVTGAGRGWGHSISRTLARHGARVVAVSEVECELQDLARIVRDEGGEIVVQVVDLTDRAATERFARDVLYRHGRVDTLVNGAAILRNRLFLDLSQDEVEDTLEVMLLAPMRLIRAFLPGMIEAGHGAIINISSRAGRVGFAREAEYCAAKFGLEGFSYALATELEPHNVSVNLVTPGAGVGDRPIKPTSVTAEEFATWPEERRAQYRDSMEISDAFVYLAMQDARSLTGHRFSAIALSRYVREHGFHLTENALAKIPDESPDDLPFV